MCSAGSRSTGVTGALRAGWYRLGVQILLRLHISPLCQHDFVISSLLPFFQLIIGTDEGTLTLSESSIAGVVHRLRWFLFCKS